MKQLVIKDGKIKRFVNGGEKIDGAIEVTCFDGRVGMHKDQFIIKGTEWHVKPLSQQVADKVVEVPTGYVLDGERFRPMKELELVEAGLKETPKGQKLVDRQLVAMTLDEQFEEGEITEEEYNEQFNANIIAQIRAIEDTDTYRRKLLLVTIGEAADEDITWLKTKEEEKQELRDRLKNTT